MRVLVEIYTYTILIYIYIYILYTCVDDDAVKLVSCSRTFWTEKATRSVSASESRKVAKDRRPSINARRGKRSLTKSFRAGELLSLPRCLLAHPGVLGKERLVRKEVASVLAHVAEGSLIAADPCEKYLAGAGIAPFHALLILCDAGSTVLVRVCFRMNLSIIY